MRAAVRRAIERRRLDLPTEGAVAEFFFEVEDSGDLALSAIAEDLRRQVNDHADYDAVLLA